MLRLHRRAREEIQETAAWYESRSPGLGSRFVDAVRQVFEALESDSRRFAHLETLSDDIPIRRALVQDFPYLVIFELMDEDVFVYAVAHAARRPHYWKQRKKSTG